MFRGRYDGPGGGVQRKRAGGGDDLGGGVAKRSKTDGVWDLRFLIPSQRAGAIIGKSGKQIVELRSSFNCKLVVPDCEGVPERLMLVRVSRNLLPQLLTSILQKLTGSDDNDSKTRAELKLLLHQKEAVALIGKGGARIKDIREKTTASIKIFDKTCPLSSDKVVRVAGTTDVVTDAIRTVCESLENEDVQIGDHFTYDPANYEPYTAYEWGGMDPSDENFALSSNPKARAGGMGGARGMVPPPPRDWAPAWGPPERAPAPRFPDYGDYGDYPSSMPRGGDFDRRGGPPHSQNHGGRGPPRNNPGGPRMPPRAGPPPRRNY
ncbi:heterogeneous nuclear ribonucleoprotein K-like [Varroa jacobsoni]|uniref:K Homology domain-containing protein n=1 Tax=Varroa destructor TaxID=109461 RepID=A0A7M7J658_VARDE|nr:heterogeneous nuclear ribonucleoprotein K-like [Varroa destructor]XP_022710114.1 heterogeneous nuclear ribonucleoprotein K-like [Varroa jacobsoni]